VLAGAVSAYGAAALLIALPDGDAACGASFTLVHALRVHQHDSAPCPCRCGLAVADRVGRERAASVKHRAAAAAVRPGDNAAARAFAGARKRDFARRRAGVVAWWARLRPRARRSGATFLVSSTAALPPPRAGDGRRGALDGESCAAGAPTLYT
jgi:hypothetical protein